MSSTITPSEDRQRSPALRGQWFALMLELSFVGGLTSRYVDFPSAQRAALTMLADTTGAQLDPEDADRIPA